MQQANTYADVYGDVRFHARSKTNSAGFCRASVGHPKGMLPGAPRGGAGDFAPAVFKNAVSRTNYTGGGPTRYAGGSTIRILPLHPTNYETCLNQAGQNSLVLEEKKRV